MSTTQPPPPITSLHHLKLPCTNIQTTQTFYTSILNLKHLPQYDHHNASGALFATIAQFPHHTTTILLEFRHNPAQAKAQEGWDPITFGVKTRADLEDWKDWFERNRVRCSRVLRGIKGWVVCALDPDGRVVRLYCEEEHEWDEEGCDRDGFWLA